MTIDRTLLREAWRSWMDQDLPHAGPAWLQALFTLLFCVVLAVPFTILGFIATGHGEGAWRDLPGWLDGYLRSLVVCLCIGGLVHGLYLAVRAALGGPGALRRLRPWQRRLYFSGLPLLALLVGWPLGMTLAGADVLRWAGTAEGANALAGLGLLALVLSAVFQIFFVTRKRRIEAERLAAEAQLRLLQGQIEPHFLFNTLANVLALIDHQPAHARQMLEAFTDYLRASLAGLRQAEGTVGLELDLAESYLRLMAARMAERLRFRIEGDAAARAQPLPPLLLQPLVENAVVHGLEPKAGGGTVRVAAQVEGAELVVTVEDDGLGLGRSRHRGQGLALQATRERLQARYGSAGRLELAAREVGTRATLRLPLGERGAAR